MTDNTELKRLAEALLASDDHADFPGWMAASDAFDNATGPAAVLALIAENERLKLDLKSVVRLNNENADLFKAKNDQLRAEVAGLKTGYGAYERVNAELKAEVEEFKAVAVQPASLNASPAADYEALKRQFFALRNYALCKDKLSGYYSRELEKLRGVDRSQSAGEIDAERDINEQLTNDLLAAETKIEALRKDAERLDFIESQNHKTLRFYKKKWSFEGFTNYEYSVFKSLREAIDAAMGKGEQS